MSGDWIKMRTDLADDPAVIGIGRVLNLDPDLVVGKLHRFWSWAGKHTKSGALPNVDFEWIDNYLRTKNFSEAMSSQGWLAHATNGICVPRFKRHNGKSAKQRALAARRAATHRSRKSNARSVTKSDAREEKRREEKTKGDKSPLETPAFPPELSKNGFTELWKQWVKHREEIKHPLTPTMIEKQVKMLAGIGHEKAVEMIEHTIAMGWQGLRAPDVPSRGKAGQADLLDDLPDED